MSVRQLYCINRDWEAPDRHRKIYNHWVKNKKKLAEIARQKHGTRCYYCHTPNAETTDHLTPIVRDGTNDVDNLVPCCKKCNSQKNSKTLSDFLKWRHDVLACAEGQIVSTIRVSKTRDYSVVSNYAANDKSLSWKAKGILYYLLTKPDSWTVNRDNLVHMATDGETSVRSALCELESRGYLRRIRKQLPNGRFEWESVLYEVPSKTAPSGQEPSGGFPPLDKTPLLNTDKEKTESVFIEEPLQGEELVPKSTIIEPLPVTRKSRSTGLGRDTQERERSVEELYRAYREVYDSIPLDVDIHQPAYAKVKPMLTALHLDCKATPEQLRFAMKKLLSSRDKRFVTAKVLLEEWQALIHTFTTAKTPTIPRSAPPLPTPTITEIDTTPYTEEQRLALRKSMWEAMWVERKHAASTGYFPHYQERIAYNALTDAQKAESRAQGYVEGFCPVFEEYLAEI